MSKTNCYNIYDKETQRFIPLGIWITKKMKERGLSANNLMWEVSELPEEEKEEKLKGATWRGYVANIRAGREKIPLNMITRFLSSLGCSGAELKHYQSEIMRCYLPSDLRGVIKPYLRGAYRKSMEDEIFLQARYTSFIASADFHLFEKTNSYNKIVCLRLNNNLDQFGLKEYSTIRKELCIKHAEAMKLLEKIFNRKVVDKLVSYTVAMKAEPILGKMAHDILQEHISQIKDYPESVKSYTEYQPTESEKYEIYTADKLVLSKDVNTHEGLLLGGHTSDDREKILLFWMNVEGDDLDFRKPMSELVRHTGLARLAKFYIERGEFKKQDELSLKEVLKSIFNYFDELPNYNIKTFVDLKREFEGINGEGTAVISECYDELFKKLCRYFLKKDSKVSSAASVRQFSPKLEIEEVLPKKLLGLEEYKSLKAIYTFLSTILPPSLVKKMIDYITALIATKSGSKARQKIVDSSLRHEIYEDLVIELSYYPYTSSSDISVYKHYFQRYLPTLNFAVEVESEEIDFLTYLIQQLDYEGSLPSLETIW